MFTVFSFSMLYERRDGRQITEPDALEMLKKETGYRSFLLTNSWGEYPTFLRAFQAYREVPRNHFCHMVVGYTTHAIEFCYEGVVIYEDGRPYLVFGTSAGG